MSKVFVSVGTSLDGFIAGPNGGPQNPMGGASTSIHQWIFNQKAFLERLKIEGSGESGRDNDIVQETFERIGANIMGKRMFDEGEVSWPEEAPFRTPVFVLTRENREPWERPGGTVFHFVSDDIRTVLEKAREAAGEKDVRISGGANVIQQYLNAGLVDELNIQLAPVILGGGVRLFDHIEFRKLSLEIDDVVKSPLTTHLRYKVTLA